MIKNKVTIYVPRDLYEEIKRRVESSQGEFKSVEDYVEFVLREVVKEEKPVQVYTPEEEEDQATAKKPRLPLERPQRDN